MLFFVFLGWLLPYGVIGNTTVFGTVILGSSPGGAAEASVFRVRLFPPPSPKAEGNPTQFLSHWVGFSFFCLCRQCFCFIVLVAPCWCWLHSVRFLVCFGCFVFCLRGLLVPRVLSSLLLTPRF